MRIACVRGRCARRGRGALFQRLQLVRQEYACAYSIARTYIPVEQASCTHIADEQAREDRFTCSSGICVRSAGALHVYPRRTSCAKACEGGGVQATSGVLRAANGARSPRGIRAPRASGGVLRHSRTPRVGQRPAAFAHPARRAASRDVPRRRVHQ